MHELRRARRKQTNDTIEVFDLMQERVLGRIGNLSESGMLLIGTESPCEDALYQLRITLPGPGGPRQISVGAHHLWSDAANMPGQIWSGFRFIDIGHEDGLALRAWIDQPGGQFV